MTSPRRSQFLPPSTVEAILAESLNACDLTVSKFDQLIPGSYAGATTICLRSSE
jgi:hypothetical protein